MIGFIEGTLIYKKAPVIMVKTGGVDYGIGYEITVPMTTLYHLPKLGEKTALFTHLVVRDDAHLLYGFTDDNERAMFRELIKVNGVGPKVALGILSGMEGAVFAAAIMNNDVAALVKLPGIGKKTAERLIIEMRDRLAKNEALSQLSTAEGQTIHASNSARSDAISALVSLGYKEKVAEKVIAKIREELSSEDYIRTALKQL